MGIHASVRSVLKSAPPRRPRLVTASASVQYPEMQRVASHGRRHRTWVPAFRGPQFKIMFKIRSKIRLKIQYTVLIYSTVQRSQPFSRSCSAFWERRVVSWTLTLDFLRLETPNSELSYVLNDCGLRLQRSQPFSRSCSAIWERRVVSWR